MLINKYIPDYQFNEIHKTNVHASASEAYNATKELDLSKSRIIEVLFRLRGLPFHNKKLAEVNNDMKFTLLEEIPHSEFLYGFWFSTKTEWVTDLNEFKKNSLKYNAKVGWSFCFNTTPEGTTDIITETRVLCLNKKSKFIFSIYWFFIRPFSGIIRIEMLRLIKNKLNTKEQ
ncbi:MAG: hypothetical protein RIC90_00725 [Balneola sp.]